jgi:hypothetical protein
MTEQTKQTNVNANDATADRASTDHASTAVVPAPETAMAIPLPDDLARELAGLGALDDLDKEDRPIPFKAYNVKLKDKLGAWQPRDVFLDTTTEEKVSTIDAVLLHLRKTRRSAIYEEGVGTKVLCRSNDKVTGITAEGESKDCKSCPLKDWVGDEKPQCGIVYNLIGLDINNGMSPFVVRAKSTSLQPARKYIAKWFSKKLDLGNGNFADLPLFVYKTRLSLDMPTGNYAVLNFANIAPCTEAEIREFKNIYDYFKDSAKADAALEADAPENVDGGDGDNNDESTDFLD